MRKLFPSPLSRDAFTKTWLFPAAPPVSGAMPYPQINALLVK